MFQKQPLHVVDKESDVYSKTPESDTFFIKLCISRLQRKTPTQLFSSEFWENFKNTFYITNIFQHNQL